ncbi:MAG: hydrolase, partial [Flavobacteriaceae bacterium]
FKDFGAFGDVTPFFSRRIGVAKDLDGNTIENKIVAGARLSGKINSNLRLGFLNVLTDADVENEIPSNLNTVFTLRQKVFDRSNVSFFFIDRRTTEKYDFIDEQEEKNSVTGIEYNLASKDSKWTGRAFFHKSFTQGLNNDDMISGMRLQRNTLQHRVSMEVIHGGEDFRSDLGFFRRTGFLKISPSYTYRIYPKNPNVNRYDFSERSFFVFNPRLNYQLTDRWFITSIRKSYLNNTNFQLQITNRYEFLVDGFDPTRSDEGIPLPGNASYNFTEVELSYRSDQRKKLNFDTEVSYGSFYNGTKFSIENEINWRKQPIFNASMIVNYNKIVLPKPYPTKDIWLISPKLDFTFTKTLFWTTFIQYNSQGENLGINSRLQWRFAPLSDLFLVYNDNYISSDNFSPRYRSFNLKLTYWLNI